MARPRHLGLGIATAVLVAALAWGFMPRPVPVDIARATLAPLRVTVEEEGRTRVIDRYSVSAPVAGYARRIELDVGDSVEQDQTLVELEPLRSTELDPRSRALAEAQVAAAQARLQVTEQNARAASTAADIAKNEFVRRKTLAADQRISVEERDRAEAAMQTSAAQQRSAQFAVDVARHELAAAHTALQHFTHRANGVNSDHITVPAPIDGRVLSILRESEGVVAAGQALIEVGNPAALEIEIDVLSADAVRIQPGMIVEFTRWGGPDPLQGRVRVVEPTGFTKISALGVEEQRVRIIAAITTPADTWTRLGNGYRVEAVFILWQGDAVLQIPASALFRHQDGWAVFQYDGTHARLLPIEIGHNNGFAAEIIRGLKVDDTVIVHPSDMISDGVRVTPR